MNLFRRKIAAGDGDGGRIGLFFLHDQPRDEVDIVE